MFNLFKRKPLPCYDCIMREVNNLMKDYKNLILQTGDKPISEYSESELQNLIRVRRRLDNAFIWSKK